MDVTQRLSRAHGWGRQLSAIQARRLLMGTALAITVAVALGLRLYGLGWDQGYSYTPHPDERAILMRVADLSPPALGELTLLLNSNESPWNPRWFPYGSFPLYLLKGVQLLYSTWPGAELGDLRIAGRAISALADVATVLVVFLLGSRVYGRREALLASALVALAVIHVQLSHFYSVDTLLALFTVVALYFMYRVAKEGRPRDSLLAGAFIGLGLATKLSQAPAYIAFVMAHLFFVLGSVGGQDVTGRTMWERARVAVKGLAFGTLALLGVFLVVQPYALLDWPRFYGDFVEQSEMVRRIRDYPYTRQYIDTTPYWYHIRQLATWGLGWPLGAVAWAGLAYTALRGLRLRYGLTYVAAGWGVPMGILLLSTSLSAIIVASAIAFAAILAIFPLRSPGTRLDLLLLSWVVPYFLITGALEVKFLRYLVPITPFLLLFGSKMLFALWDWSSLRMPRLRPLVVAGFVFLIASTGAYALLYMAVYSEPHTAVRTAQWINRHAPEGSVVLKEHWEEGLPNLAGYEVRELPLYGPDTTDKLDQVAGMLAGADYVAFFSNRLYGTIPRLPDRYPDTREYYRLLFAGELGYELANVETAYPRLAGVSFVDDTFGRPGLAKPSTMGPFQPSGLKLDLGFADESFSVYDHPMGLVFQNVAGFDAETIAGKIETAASSARFQSTLAGSPTPLLFSPEDAEAQQRGGTWADIILDDSWTNRLPVLAWLIVAEGIALLAFPLGFLLFRPLADRGYLLSKMLGLLAVSLVVWLLASAQWMAFSRASVSVALLLLAVASLVALAGRGPEITTFLRERWRIVAVGEAVFLLAFFSFVLLRMANPDLWHPFLGGEKPMDMAYLNAVLRSSYMPPYDPWFGGGYMNYYYWGQFMVATLIHATGIAPAVAYNLAVPLFFALTVGGAFSIVYNLAEATRRRLDPGRLTLSRVGSARWSPVAAGMIGALFVTVLGNLDGAIQVGQGIWRVAVRNMPFGVFDFWQSSRMMPPGNEITEFPFFTFLFADLHAHMMVIPFALLALGVALAVVLGATRDPGGSMAGTAWTAMSRWRVGEIARLAALGIAVGVLRLINTWDFPTYLIIAVAAVFLAGYFKHGGLGLVMLVESGLKSLVVLAAGYLVFLPFHFSYEAPFDAPFGLLDATTNQTVLWQFLSIVGLFVFIIGSFFVSESKSWLQSRWRAVWARVASLTQVSGAAAAAIPVGETSRIVTVRVWTALLVAVFAGVVVYGTISTWAGSTIPFLVALVALVLAAGIRVLRSWRADAPQLAFVAVMVGAALMLAIGLDIFRVEGDIDRMNSVFKFYLQIWVLLALASAYLLWRMWHSGWLQLPKLGTGRRIWLGLLAALLVSASIYPVLGTRERLKNRFEVLPLTLDGTAYMHNAVYRDVNGQIDLSADYEGIQWLLGSVEGSPVILEGVAPQYRWGSRISVYTGLPTVVGWKWHQEQQRWDYREAVGQRVKDVERMYSTTDVSAALSLMRKYSVEYVYVGRFERLYYPADGLAKFESELSEHLELVHRSEGATIYRVR